MSAFSVASEQVLAGIGRRGVEAERSLVFHSRNVWHKIPVLECSYMRETAAMNAIFFILRLRAASQSWMSRLPLVRVLPRQLQRSLLDKTLAGRWSSAFERRLFDAALADSLATPGISTSSSL